MNISIKDIDANLLYYLYSQPLASVINPRFLKKIVFGDQAYTPESGSLTFENGLAVISCKFSADGMYNKLISTGKLTGDKIIIASAENDESFIAEQVFESRRSISGTGLIVTLKSDKWSLGNRIAYMWAGYLSAKIPNPFGNLSLSVDIGDSYSASNSHLHLEGSVYNYYILRSENKDFNDLLIINTNGKSIDFHLVNRELSILSFCLGYPITCNFFTGIDEEGKVVGNIGGNFGDYRIKRNFRDLPVPSNHNQSWAEVLFNQLCVQSYKNDVLSERIREAIKLYVEASAETNLPSREIKLLTAGLTIAWYFLKDSSYVLISQAKWQAWLSENKSRIKSIAKDDDVDLISFQLEQLNKPDPVSIITIALRKAGLDQEQLFLKTVRRSQEVMLGIFYDEDNTPEHALLRTEVLRVLCVGLIASSIGYRGPITVRHSKYYPLMTPSELEDWQRLDSWWSSDSALTPYQYSAKVTQVLRVPTSELWPVFKRPTIPENSLIQIIQDFANSLLSRTNGLVRARLLPLPVFFDEQPRLYDFLLESIKSQQVSTVLFTIRQESQTSTLEIINWEDGPEFISDEHALFLFLREVAISQKTRHAVERLLLATYNE